MGILLVICVVLGLHHVFVTAFLDSECGEEGHFMLHPTNRCKYIHCTLSLEAEIPHFQGVAQECPLGTAVPNSLYQRKDSGYASRKTLCTDNIPLFSIGQCQVFSRPVGKSLRPSFDYSGAEEEDYGSSSRFSSSWQRPDSREDTSQRSPHQWYNILVERQLHSHIHNKDSRPSSDERRQDKWSQSEESDRYGTRRYSARHGRNNGHELRSSSKKASWGESGSYEDSVEQHPKRGYVSNTQHAKSRERGPPMSHYTFNRNRRKKNSKPRLPSYSGFMDKDFRGRKGNSKSSFPSYSSFRGNDLRVKNMNSKPTFSSYPGFMDKDFSKDYFSDRNFMNKGFDTSFYPRRGLKKPSNPNLLKREIDNNNYGNTKTGKSNVKKDPFLYSGQTKMDFDFTSKDFSDSEFNSNDFYKDFTYDFPYKKFGPGDGVRIKDGKKSVADSRDFGYENTFDMDFPPFDYDYKYPYEKRDFDQKSSKEVSIRQRKADDDKVRETETSGSSHESNKMVNRKKPVTIYPWNNLGYVIVYTTPSPTLSQRTNIVSSREASSYEDASVNTRDTRNESEETDRNSQGDKRRVISEENSGERSTFRANVPRPRHRAIGPRRIGFSDGYGSKHQRKDPAMIYGMARPGRNHHAHPPNRNKPQQRQNLFSDYGFFMDSKYDERKGESGQLRNAFSSGQGRSYDQAMGHPRDTSHSDSGSLFAHTTVSPALSDNSFGTREAGQKRDNLQAQRMPHDWPPWSPLGHVRSKQRGRTPMRNPTGRNKPEASDKNTNRNLNTNQKTMVQGGNRKRLRVIKSYSQKKSRFIPKTGSGRRRHAKHSPRSGSKQLTISNRNTTQNREPLFDVADPTESPMKTSAITTTPQPLPAKVLGGTPADKIINGPHSGKHNVIPSWRHKVPRPVIVTPDPTRGYTPRSIKLKFRLRNFATLQFPPEVPHGVTTVPSNLIPTTTPPRLARGANDGGAPWGVKSQHESEIADTEVVNSNFHFPSS